MVQRSLKKHRGKIGLSAQVEMAMPGDSLSISLAPGAQGSTKAVCPTLSNQDAMKIDQILRIVEDFHSFLQFWHVEAILQQDLWTWIPQTAPK